MTRFVVLHHVLPTGSSRDDHFDLMLEDGPVLATWEIAGWPPQASQPARRLADHRHFYLDYSGPVSGNRGEVRPVCHGRFETLERDETRWVLKLDSEVYRATFTLQAGTEPRAQCWTLSVVPATTSPEPAGD